MNKNQSSTTPAEGNGMMLLTPEHQHWNVVKSQAKAFIMSGLLREDLTRGVSQNEALAKVCTVITMGDELGIGRMQALRSINVIKGKPTLAAELMLALAYKRIPGFKATFKTPTEKQHLECEVVMQRPDGEPNTFKFTLEDAKKAGLQFVSQRGEPTSWTKYPRAMLRARVISEGLRAVAPDATMGLYATEELASDIVDVEPTHGTQNKIDAAEVKASQESVASGKKAEPPKTQPTGNTIGYDKRHEAKMNEPCTEAQVKRLHAIGKEMGVDHDELKSYALDVFGRDHLAELTKGEIQEFFKELESGSTSESEATVSP